MDTQNRRAGAVWTQEIPSAIASADIFNAVVTPGINRSRVCGNELICAVDSEKFIIPVLGDSDLELP